MTEVLKLEKGGIAGLEILYNENKKYQFSLRSINDCVVYQINLDSYPSDFILSLKEYFKDIHKEKSKQLSNYFNQHNQIAKEIKVNYRNLISKKKISEIKIGNNNFFANNKLNVNNLNIVLKSMSSKNKYQKNEMLKPKSRVESSTLLTIETKSLDKKSIEKDVNRNNHKSRNFSRKNLNKTESQSMLTLRKNYNLETYNTVFITTNPTDIIVERGLKKRIESWKNIRLANHNYSSGMFSLPLLSFGKVN